MDGPTKIVSYRGTTSRLKTSHPPMKKKISKGGTDKKENACPYAKIKKKMRDEQKWEEKKSHPSTKLKN
jgi:hypothetical protein